MTDDANEIRPGASRSELAHMVAVSGACFGSGASNAMGSGPRPAIRDLIALVAYDFAVDPAVVTSKTRVPAVLQPRQVAMWLAHRVFGYPSKRVGRDLGGRDHSTVLHAANRVDQQRLSDRQFAGRMSALVRAAQDLRPLSAAPAQASGGLKSDNLAPASMTGRQAEILVSNPARPDLQPALPSQLPARLRSEVAHLEQVIARLDPADRPKAWGDTAAAAPRDGVILAARAFVGCRGKREKAPAGRARIEAAGAERAAFDRLVEAFQIYDRARTAQKEKAG